jgi:hypothetical protein
VWAPQLREKFPSERDKLPSLPGKHHNFFRNSSTNPKVISERKGLLDKYLTEVLKVDAIARSKILKRWLDPGINVPPHTLMLFCVISAQGVGRPRA